MMRALSLTQPWASLMASDAKRYETRDWRTRERGWIAIAASKGFPPEERSLCLTEPFRDAILEAGYSKIAPSLGGSTGRTSPPYLPLGAVVCLVKLVDCIATAAEGAERRLTRRPAVDPAPNEQAFGNYSPGRHVFITRGVLRLPSPVPVERVEGSVLRAGGALGFYTLSPRCEEAILEQLGCSWATCPRCRRGAPDFDGFGVVRCSKDDGGCGYCKHPARTGGRCDICGALS